MVRSLITLLTVALSLLVVDIIVPGVNIATFVAALIAGLAIGAVNATVRPVVSALSLPLTFVSFGLFSLVVNGFCFWLASVLVPGFSVHGLLGFILAPVVLSFVNTFLTTYLAERRPELVGAKTTPELKAD